MQISSTRHYYDTPDCAVKRPPSNTCTVFYFWATNLGLSLFVNWICGLVDDVHVKLVLDTVPAKNESEMSCFQLMRENEI